jgi:restriction system protein
MSINHRRYENSLYKKRRNRKKVRKLFSHVKPNIDKNQDLNEEENPELRWQEKLIDLLQNLTPGKFERLCQRTLLELGFINVIVTGRSGDGGIDGSGVIKIGGVLSIRVVFQCKRYKGSVSSSFIRDFRGAMIGRADKGLFITTGTFTRKAIKEAQRDGAPPIDLMDGLQFSEKLKELKLGITIDLIEDIKINKEWFLNF